MSEKQPTFEEAMEELENIVEQLEQGDVPLEKSIQLFQDGMKLSKVCHDKLSKVEKQMDEILTEDDEVRSFDLQESD